MISWSHVWSRDHQYVSAAERQALRKTPLVGRVWITVFISLLVIPRAHLRWYVLCYQMLYIGFLFVTNWKYVSRLRKQLLLQAIAIGQQHWNPLLWLVSLLVTRVIGYFRGSPIRWVLLLASWYRIASRGHGYPLLSYQRFSFGNTERVCRQKNANYTSWQKLDFMWPEITWVCAMKAQLLSCFWAAGTR